MGDDILEVIVAGYQDVDLARRRLRRHFRFGKELGNHDKTIDSGCQGRRQQRHARRHRRPFGPKGAAGWCAGVRAMVGLFAPPLLASVVVAGAAGGLVNKFADHQLKTGIHDNIGQSLPPGRAAVIGVLDRRDRLAREQAMPG